MNKQPVSYLQTDSRWKKLPYRVSGETSTIGGSGCGPTSAAMVIETLTRNTFTPVDACKWSVDHGYKAKGQGTYFSYFVPQFKAFGIDCKQLSGFRLSNNPDHPLHDQVKDYLSQGYYAIALMGPGLWTSGGHFILLWDWDDKVRINDPASKKEARLNGDPALFKKQVRNYWLIDARSYNGDDEMTYEDWKVYMDRYLEETAKNTASEYAEPHIKACVDKGIFQNAGTAEAPEIARPQSFITRQDSCVAFSQLLKELQKG